MLAILLLSLPLSLPFSLCLFLFLFIAIINIFKPKFFLDLGLFPLGKIPRNGIIMYKRVCTFLQPLMRIAKSFFKGLGRFLHSHEQWELGGLSVVRRKWALCSGGLGEFSLEGGAQTGSGAWDGGREQGLVLGVRNDRE